MADRRPTVESRFDTNAVIGKLKEVDVETIPSSNESVHDSVKSYPCNKRVVSRYSEPYFHEDLKSGSLPSTSEQRSMDMKPRRWKQSPVSLPTDYCANKTVLAGPEKDLFPINSLLNELQGLRFLRVALGRELKEIGREQALKRMKIERKTVYEPGDLLLSPASSSVDVTRRQKIASKAKRLINSGTSVSSYSTSAAAQERKGSYLVLLEKRRREVQKPPQNTKQKEPLLQEVPKVRPSHIPKPSQDTSVVLKRTYIKDSMIPKPDGLLNTLYSDTAEISALRKSILAIDSRLQRIEKLKAQRKLHTKHYRFKSYQHSVHKNNLFNSLNRDGTTNVQSNKLPPILNQYDSTVEVRLRS